ncbi:MAG: HD domain-containing phosphohydrolase [Nitrospirota bacterium]
MAERSRRENTSAIQEIKGKNRQLNFIIFFVIITLFAVIVRYLYHPISSFLDFLPDISITVMVGMVFLLSLAGLYLSVVLTRQTVRIIEDYSKRLDRLLNITRDLREELYGDILLEKIMDYALSITSSDAGSILLIDDEGKLVFKIVKGEKTSKLIGTSVEKGKGISGWVAEKGQPARVNDAQKDGRFNRDIDSLTGFETKSILCVPLRTKSGAVGVLELLNKKGGYPYRQRDEEIITYLADQAAISIIKTKFYEDQKNYEIHLTEMLLEAIDFQLPEKQGHTRRVARYSNIIARSLNMSEDEKKRLYFASLLHDVGFLKIKADDAFRKEEYIRHPELGYNMIKPINFYSEIAPFILHHHERYDGFGYPSRLKGEEIPLESRIIAIAEAFDAMVSRISYRVPVSFEEAKEELKRHEGTQFDPELVGLFVNSITPEHTQ